MTSDATASSRASSRTLKPQPGPGRGSGSRRIWWVALLVAWAVLLLGLTYLSVRRDPPTVREQRSVAEAVPVVQHALGELAAAAAGPGVAVELAPPELTRGCRVTVVRDGAILTQKIIFRTAEADAPGLLDRLAQRLPDGYRAVARHGDNGKTGTLYADAGEFVAVKGRISEPGVLTVTATTGCRPVPADFSAGPQPASAGPQSASGQPAQKRPVDLLAALHAEPVKPPSSVSATCPGGGELRTTWATGRRAGQQGGQRLADVLRPPAGSDAVVVLDRPDRYAYRSGMESVLAEILGDQVRVAVTKGC